MGNQISKLTDLIQQLSQASNATARAGSNESSRRPSGLYQDTPDQPLPSIETLAVKKRTAEVPNPDKLNDGKQPSFDSWETEVLAKLRINADHFAEEDAKIYYIYNHMEGDARKHLFPWYQAIATDPYSSAQEMIKHLRGIMINPYRVREAYA